MAYSADGTSWRNRFFSCGTSKDGESYIFEWNESEGGLPASPRIRFNKDGTLLAVSANDYGIKLLANTDGIRLLRTVENRSYDASRASEAIAKLAVHDM
ncbi:hypothetical protein K2173_019245 [Erythroxylum novogranatense]|uniref:Uncharacterized protein n=1 Tax=Erythroxylum novogranatense TaxID=1862640 RepID=A0AAV8ST50_9ROSI|nr:hypothetical protein K2173_019245 [Erythroxylum novogranatense]